MTAAQLILGTRGSALALAQTQLALSALRDACPDRAISVREVRTTGDQRQDLSLTHLAPGGHGYQAGGGVRSPERVDPGLFTRELETELLEGRIHVAVHSLKDLPTVMPVGLKLAAVLPRADTTDVLILKLDPTQGDGLAAHTPLSRVPPGATIATSSLRRQRQLLQYRPDLRVTEVRGNVGTRLGKLRDRVDWTGLVLARAGLERLSYGESLLSGWLAAEGARFAVEVLGPGVMLPAVGQGAIGLQARADDAETLAALSAVNHAPTWAAVTVERELLRLLGGGCQMPLGVHTGIDEAKGTLRLRAVLFGAEGASPRFAEATGFLRDLDDVASSCAASLQGKS
jgi:hydroxymethylbilane synthase